MFPFGNAAATAAATATTSFSSYRHPQQQQQSLAYWAQPSPTASATTAPPSFYPGYYSCYYPFQLHQYSLTGATGGAAATPADSQLPSLPAPPPPLPPLSTIAIGNSEEDAAVSPPQSREGSGRRRQRNLFSPAQVKLLERSYSAHRFINSSQRGELAKQTSLTCNQVKIWYQNRRYKERKLAKDISFGLQLQRECVMGGGVPSIKMKPAGAVTAHSTAPGGDNDENASAIGGGKKAVIHNSNPTTATTNYFYTPSSNYCYGWPTANDISAVSLQRPQQKKTEGIN